MIDRHGTPKWSQLIDSLERETDLPQLYQRLLLLEIALLQRSEQLGKTGKKSAERLEIEAAEKRISSLRIERLGFPTSLGAK